ncbi:MAG: hypothetical protein R2788_21235 [Saprospiraceae bacterium]
MIQRSFYRQWRNFSDSPKTTVPRRRLSAKQVGAVHLPKNFSKSTFKNGRSIERPTIRLFLQYDSIQVDGGLADYISEKGSTFKPSPLPNSATSQMGNWLLNVIACDVFLD